MRLLFFVLFVALSVFSIAQNDTINRKDEKGRKQGYWVYYGKDRPNAGYPAEGKIEEGAYVDDRKTGLWIKYYRDGVTKRIQAVYKNNRPFYPITKFDSLGRIKEIGEYNFSKNEFRRWNYFPSGDLASYESHISDRDTSLYYFENGCLEKVYYSDIDSNKTYNYREDSCDIVIDSVVRSNHRVTNCSWAPKDVEIQYAQDGSILQSNKKEKDSSLAPKYPEMWDENLCWGRANDELFSKMNDNDEVIFKGTCREGEVWEGKMYFFDRDGILLKVEIWENGKYVKEGTL